MFKRKIIYPLLFLPFLISIVLFSSVFLTACACQPSPGKKLNVQIINSKLKDQKVVLLPIFKKFINQLSNRLFERKNNQPALFIKKLNTLNWANDKNVKEFIETFNSHEDHYFNPIEIFVSKTTLVDKKNYPAFIVLPKTSKELTNTGRMKIVFSFAKKWTIATEIDLIFKFPKPTSEQKQRFANGFNLPPNDQLKFSIDSITTI